MLPAAQCNLAVQNQQPNQTIAPTCIAQRADVQRVPKGPPILAVVEQRDCDRPRRLGGQRLPELLHCGWVGARALQEAAVAAHHLAAGLQQRRAEDKV